MAKQTGRQTAFALNSPTRGKHRELLAKSCLYEAQQCTSIEHVVHTRAVLPLNKMLYSCTGDEQWSSRQTPYFLLTTKQAGAKTTLRSAPRNKNKKPCGASFGLFSHWLSQFIATEQWIELTKMNKHEMGWQHVPFMLDLYGHLKTNWAHAFILQTTYIQALYIIIHYWLNTPWSYI